jgi:hypothetical protein
VAITSRGHDIRVTRERTAVINVPSRCWSRIVLSGSLESSPLRTMM